MEKFIFRNIYSVCTYIYIDACNNEKRGHEFGREQGWREGREQVWREGREHVTIS